MTLTFEGLIAHNKRVSLILVLLMVGFLTILFGIFALTFAGPNGEFQLELFSTGAVIGACAAIIGALVSYFFGSNIITTISKARRVEYFEDPVLFNVVEEMAIAAGVPTPKIYVIFDESPNAFATGRDPEHALVGITSGLRKKLSRDELQAVIAHEMAHIKNFDIRLMMLVGVFAGIIVLVSDLFMRRFVNNFGFVGRSSQRGRSRSSSGGKGSGGAYVAIVIIVAVLLAWLAPLIAKVLQLAVSREREYLADATAVQLCRNPLALASALKKLAMDPEPLECDNRATEHMFIINPDPKRRFTNANTDSIWATHPPLIKRISRLRKVAGLSEETQAASPEPGGL